MENNIKIINIIIINYYILTTFIKLQKLILFVINIINY